MFYYIDHCVVVEELNLSYYNKETLLCNLDIPIMVTYVNSLTAAQIK